MDLKQIVEYKLEEILIPADESITYLLHPKLPYKADKDCKVQPVDDPTDECNSLSLFTRATTG